MVRRGIVPSRVRAAAVIGEGQVLVSGAVAEKPSRLVAPSEPIELLVPARYVSRGGLKLEAALDRFGVDVGGRRCLDAGASTGGFTECLLQRGAASVVAVDVGRGQLAPRLRADPRVRVLEGVNARDVSPEMVGEPADVVTADLSFISLRLVARALAGAASPTADFVFLVKPQFEAGRERVGRGGVVRDPDVHQKVLQTVVADLAVEGLAAVGVIPSPLRGAEGNVEFFAHLLRGDTPAVGGADIERAVLQARDFQLPDR